jgi:hypothetical protein
MTMTGGTASASEADGAVWLYGENLTVHFAEPRLFETQFKSPQLLLWEPGPEDWHVVLRLPGYAPRRRAVPAAIQLPLLPQAAAATE